MSQCCNNCSSEDLRKNSSGDASCNNCGWEDQEDNECVHCGGEGEVAVDVLDPDSMRYMAGVGSQPCICQLEN